MGLMMSSQGLLRNLTHSLPLRFSPLCSGRSIDPASFSASSCLLLPSPLRFSFSARDCSGYDFSFLPTITYARKRIYGIKREHPSSVASKIQSDERICRRFLTRKRKKKREKERESAQVALTNQVAVCFGQRTGIRRKASCKLKTRHRKCTKVKRKQTEVRSRRLLCATA